ncbi:MAG: type II secretion system protein [Kiritimatiellae bacterium]|nr:type II secretion system protein [Kiritimatiellia bacterium]
MANRGNNESRDWGLSARMAGFTLVEMLVVVAIIAILTAVTLSLMQSSRDSAWRAKARDTARQIVAAWNLYLQDQHGFPAPSAFFDVAPATIGGYPTTVANLKVLNASRIYLELKKDELQQGLMDRWRQPFYFNLDFNYDGLMENPALKADPGKVPEELLVRGNAIAWSLGRNPFVIKEKSYQWVVQW